LKRFSFPKKKRLLSNREFKAVLTNGLRANDDLIVLYMAENDCGYPRLGVSVSKWCGGAVVRNRLKRLLREAFRQNQYEIPAKFDYLLMISPQWAKQFDKPGNIKKALTCLSLERLRAEFLTLVRTVVDRAGVK